MSIKSIKESVGNIDIYLFDQLLKERYKSTDKILDAGCGNGRNLYWFYQNKFNIYGIDKDPRSIAYLSTLYPNSKGNFTISELNNIPFEDHFFDHIISNAVLHFANNTNHFEVMFGELMRVLRVNGSLFIRMTSNIGIESKINEISDGVYHIPDGSRRFLITKELIDQLMKKHHLSFLEPLKTVNVNDIRCMTTLVLKKVK